MRCLDWRVLTGLGIIALVVIAIYPSWALPVLAIAAVLACSLSCWLMMRSSQGAACCTDTDNTQDTVEDRGAELARLRREIADLKRNRASGQAEAGKRDRA